MSTSRTVRLPLYVPSGSVAVFPGTRHVLGNNLSSCQFVPNLLCARGRRFYSPALKVSLQSYQINRHNSAFVRMLAAKYAVKSLVMDEQVPVACGQETATVALKVENLGGRRRRVSGGVDIDESAQRVWNVLTKYEYNEQYMPNILKSEVERLRSGDVLLEQIGIISRKLRLRTRLVMRVTEDLPTFNISFSKVEGRDFSEFEGGYKLNVLGPEKVRLEYEIIAIPMPLFPVSLVERKITKEVPGMLASIRQEAVEGNYIPF